MIAAYPLTWPDGWPRTAPGGRKYGRFETRERVHTSGQSSYTRGRDVTVAEATDRVIAELQRIGVAWTSGVIISTNVEVRRDGHPRPCRTEARVMLTDDETRAIKLEVRNANA